MLVYETSNRIKDGKNEEVQLTKNKNATTSDTLDANTTTDGLKGKTDGIYIPTDNKFVPSGDALAGAPAENVIFKFTGDAGKYTLTVKDSENAAVYTEGATVSGNGGHFYYITTKASKSAQNAGEGTYKASKFAAGTYTFSITDASSNVVLSGSFIIA